MAGLQSRPGFADPGYGYGTRALEVADAEDVKVGTAGATRASPAKRGIVPGAPWTCSRNSAASSASRALVSSATQVP